MRINRSNFGSCIGAVGAKGGLDQDQAGDLLDQVASRAESAWRTGDKNAFYKASQELAAETLEAAKRAKVDAVRNATLRAGIMADIDRNGGVRNAADTLRAMLHGTWKGGRDSIEARWKGVSDGLRALLSSKLQTAGLEKVAISGEMDKDIARELYAKNMLGPKPEKPASASGNDPARQIADIVHPMLENIRDRLNEAGAQIGDAADYVAQTRHDPEKIRGAAGYQQDRPWWKGSMLKTAGEAFAAWWKDTRPLLAEETFKDVVPRVGETMEDARTRFGRSVFEALVSGVHMTPAGAFGLKDVGPAFEGTSNMARKLSRPRMLHFRDGESWQSYMAKYGSGHSLLQGVMSTLDSGSRHLELLNRLGTNPGGNLNMILRRIEETYRSSDLDGVTAFHSKIEGIQNVMAHLDGSANKPENAMWARLGANYRTFTAASDLGSVGITHLTSLPATVPSELAHHGVNRLEAVSGIAKAMVRGKGSAELQDVLSDVGAYADGMDRDVRNNWGLSENASEKIAAIANLEMKMTGIHYVFDHARAAVREMLAHNLARNVEKAFGDLNPRLSAMLGRYGIEAPEWELLRQVPNLAVADKRSYLTPRDALRIDRQQAADLLRARGELPAQTDMLGSDQEPGAVDRFAQELSDKLYAYYGESARHSVVSAGVRERAMALGGELPGSFGGEVRRFVSQFKMWPLAAYDQMLRRDYFLSQSAGQYAWGLGSLLAMSTIGGYARMTINDLSRGETPPDPRKIETLLAAAAQGGGLSVVGDFLLGETNRIGGDLADDLVGPAIGDAGTLLNILHQTIGDTARYADGEKIRKSGAYGDIWPELARFGVSHVPFANLAYLKGALDYLVWYHLYEAASPGWWERTNRKMAREQGRTMMAYSPGAGVPFGVPYAYLKAPGAQPTGLLAELGGGTQ